MGDPWARTQRLDRPSREKAQLDDHVAGADDGIRTRDPHLGKVARLGLLRRCPNHARELRVRLRVQLGRFPLLRVRSRDPDGTPRRSLIYLDPPEARSVAGADSASSVASATINGRESRMATRDQLDEDLPLGEHGGRTMGTKGRSNDGEERGARVANVDRRHRRGSGGSATILGRSAGSVRRSLRAGFRGL
jgi:hypothetical protein